MVNNKPLMRAVMKWLYEGAKVMKVELVGVSKDKYNCYFQHN